MKNLLKRLGLALLTFALVYLLGAFYNISFNIAEWNEISRSAVAMLGGFASFMAATFPGYDF